MTLLEVMVVLAIIGLITATIGRSQLARWREGKRQTAELQVRELSNTVQQYLLSRKTCPTVEDLVREDFLRKPPVDPWGTPLSLRCPGQHDRDGVDVLSFGPDEKEGTDDDLRSWQL
jgi:general secretion pathway protein G